MNVITTIVIWYSLMCLITFIVVVLTVLNVIVHILKFEINITHALCVSQFISFGKFFSYEINVTVTVKVHGWVHIHVHVIQAYVICISVKLNPHSFTDESTSERIPIFADTLWKRNQQKWNH